jgi:hypothetical protein
MLVLPHPVRALGLGQAAFDQIKFLLWLSDSALGLLLKGVQHLDRLCKSNGVNGAPRVALAIRYDLNNRSSSEAFQRLGRRISLSVLCCEERDAHLAPHIARKGAQILPAGA